MPNADQPRLFNALASLNKIGSRINRIGSGESVSIETTLRLIVESAIEVVPGTSAVIYIYDQEKGAFLPDSRVSAGEKFPAVPGDEPRPGGMGNRAITRRQRILSDDDDAPNIHPIKVDAGARAVACFPLIVAEEAVGALYVYLHVERAFSAMEILLLENFVNQAAMAIYHTRQVASIQRDLARREEEVLRLRRAGLLISSRSRLQDTLDAILQMALDVTDAQYGNCLLVDKSGENLIIVAVAGQRLSRPYTDNIPLEAPSVTSWVAKNRQAVRISDLQVEPWASIYFPFDHDLEMRSELAVPLIGASGRLEGVINLESLTPNAFSESDSHLLQAFATQAVIAIQEVLLLDALKEVTELLLTQPIQQVLDRLADLAVDLLNGAASAIWVREGDMLVLRATNANYQHGEQIPLHNSLAGQAVLTRQVVISNDVREDERFHRADLAHEHGWIRALVVPLAFTGAPPGGAFSVYSVESNPGRFPESEWDTKVLTILADYAALAVLNSTRQEALDMARAQHTAAETFAALGDVAANLLHQLNNKVGTIPVRIQGIQDKYREIMDDDSYLARNLSEIERSAHEAMEVVRQNMSMLRPIKPVPVDVAACVQDAIATAVATLPESIRIETDGLDGLPLVMAGKQSLSLVFVNLLENAASAMNGSGVVAIQGKVHDGRVVVKVSDTGPGIASELHGRIFEFNYSAQDTAHVGKLGFGLWWVKTLLARLGGSISVESDGQHGSTFRLKLPCADYEGEETV